jgi:hypothetical protein
MTKYDKTVYKGGSATTESGMVRHPDIYFGNLADVVVQTWMLTYKLLSPLSAMRDGVQGANNVSKIGTLKGLAAFPSTIGKIVGDSYRDSFTRWWHSVSNFFDPRGNQASPVFGKMFSQSNFAWDRELFTILDAVGVPKADLITDTLLGSKAPSRILDGGGQEQLINLDPRVVDVSRAWIQNQNRFHTLAFNEMTRGTPNAGDLARVNNIVLRSAGRGAQASAVYNSINMKQLQQMQVSASP